MNGRTNGDRDSSPLGHEPEGTNVSGIALGLVGIFAGLVVVALAVAGLTRVFDLFQPSAQAQYSKLYDLRRPPSSPSPLDDLPQLRRGLEAAQRDRLNTWGWDDPQQRFARVPIDRAMHMVIEHGLPRFDHASATTTRKGDDP